METSRENDRVECILEGHLHFMREYVRKENESAQKTLDRFLKERLRVTKTENSRSPVEIAKPR